MDPWEKMDQDPEKEVKNESGSAGLEAEGWLSNRNMLTAILALHNNVLIRFVY